MSSVELEPTRSLPGREISRALPLDVTALTHDRLEALLADHAGPAFLERKAGRTALFLR